MTADVAVLELRRKRLLAELADANDKDAATATAEGHLVKPHAVRRKRVVAAARHVRMQAIPRPPAIRLFDRPIQPKRNPR